MPARGRLRRGNRTRTEAAGHMAEAGTPVEAGTRTAVVGTRTATVFMEAADLDIRAAAGFLAEAGTPACLRCRARWAAAHTKAAGRLVEAGALTADRRQMDRRRGRSADRSMAEGRTPADRVMDSQATLARVPGVTVLAATATRRTAADHRERRITPRVDVMAAKARRWDAPDLMVA